MCFSDWSFAVNANGEEMWSMSWIIHFIVSVLSRIWVLFAKLAGEFLTNSWVYWEKLWIDVLLWQYRNIVKNMANFCLWFYLVYIIFRWLIGQFGEKWDIMKNLKNVLLWVLVAWVWIQASRFLTAAVLDLWTVTLSAVWAFPSQIVSNDENVKEGVEISMKKFFDTDGMSIATGEIYELFPKGEAANSFTRMVGFSLEKEITKENFFDILMPNKDDVSGPLYYLWFSILKVNEINSMGSWNNDSSLKKSIVNLIIQWWTTIVYSIEMGVLCIIALMRIVYLWMFIVLSPFAVLLACIQKAWEKDLLGKWFIADLMKQINLKTFLAKVFQPAIIVLWFSLCTIFATLINGIINDDQTRRLDKFDIWWVTVTTTQDPKKNDSDDVTYTNKIEWSMLEFSVSHLWKWILDFMLSIITVILVYRIIKASIKIWNSFGGGKDFLSGKIEKITKWVEDVITSVPILPVAWYDKEGVPITRYATAGRVLWRNGLISEGMDRIQRKINDVYNEQNAVIDAWFDKNTKVLKSGDKNIIEGKAMYSQWLGALTAQWNEIRRLGNRSKDDGWLGSGEGYWMVLNPDASDKWWQDRFKAWLTNVNKDDIKWDDAEIWQNMVNRWQGKAENDRTLEKMFTTNESGESSSVRAYAKLFGLWNDITKWEDLEHKDISRKK